MGLARSGCLVPVGAACSGTGKKPARLPSPATSDKPPLCSVAFNRRGYGLGIANRRQKTVSSDRRVGGVRSARKDAGAEMIGAGSMSPLPRDASVDVTRCAQASWLWPGRSRGL